MLSNSSIYDGGGNEAIAGFLSSGFIAVEEFAKLSLTTTEFDRGIIFDTSVNCTTAEIFCIILLVKVVEWRWTPVLLIVNPFGDEDVLSNVPLGL